MTSFLCEILLIFASFHNIPLGTDSLQLESINVPNVIQNGETAILTCPYILQDDKLYSMMWYKDHEEFYRFVPRNVPKQHSYHLDGVNVDLALSNAQQVVLRDVTLKSSGVYRCEVSAEAPSFSSVHDEAPMEVISIPDEDPEITGQQSVYNVGDVMALNCTSGRSYPPAKLEWFINDALVRIMFHVLPDSDFLTDEPGLTSSTASIHLLLEPHHFFNGQMTVRCVATVGPVQSFVRISPLLVNHKETSLLVQARGSSGSLRLVFNYWSIIVLLVCSKITGGGILQKWNLFDNY